MAITDDLRPELAALEDHSPPWHCWAGANDRLYARLPNSIVPLQRARVRRGTGR
jgi:hypothetical protein